MGSRWLFHSLAVKTVDFFPRKTDTFLFVIVSHFIVSLLCVGFMLMP